MRNNLLPHAAEQIRKQGKNGDSILAHINPFEAMLLKSIGGSGTINPDTGLPQFSLWSNPLKAIGIKKGKQNIFEEPMRAFLQRNQEPSQEEKLQTTRQEMLEKLQQQMYQDQVNLEKMPYPVYPGETSSPMSAMTQNARKMRDERANKPAPYSDKIRQVLTTPGQGFTPEQRNNLLGMIDRRAVSQDIAANRLNKQFGRTYGYSPEQQYNLDRRIGKDVNNALDISEANIQNLSNDLAQINNKRSLQVADSLRKAGLFKEGRKDALINQLDEFGNQEHALRNLQNRATRDEFDEEKMAPYRKLDRAKQALSGLNMDEMHPDRAAVENDRLQKIVNSYNMPHINYPGERVTGLQPETQASFDLVNRLNPKYQDVFYGQRKGIERDMLGNNLATRVHDNIPNTFDPLMAQLDKITKRQVKDATKQIGGHYGRQGTYGSGAHIAANEKAIRDVLRKVQDERETALLGSAKTQSALAGNDDQNAMMRYNVMNELGAKEFGDVLKSNAELNKLGWTKRANKQEKENEAMANWYGQLNYEWPTINNMVRDSMRGEGRNIANQGMMSPYMDMAKRYNTDLTSLFNQPQLYDENKKALNEYEQNVNKNITDMRSHYNQRQQSLMDANRQAAQRDQEAMNRRLQAERQAALARAIPNSVAAPAQSMSNNAEQFLNMFKDIQWNKYNQQLQNKDSDDPNTKWIAYNHLPQIPQGSGLSFPKTRDEFFNTPWAYGNFHVRADDIPASNRRDMWGLANSGKVRNGPWGYTLS